MLIERVNIAYLDVDAVSVCDSRVHEIVIVGGNGWAQVKPAATHPLRGRAFPIVGPSGSVPSTGVKVSIGEEQVVKGFAGHLAPQVPFAPPESTRRWTEPEQRARKIPLPNARPMVEGYAVLSE
jgi:hypothetical protein